jgi:hypothetical protein
MSTVTINPIIEEFIELIFKRYIWWTEHSSDIREKLQRQEELIYCLRLFFKFYYEKD